MDRSLIADSAAVRFWVVMTALLAAKNHVVVIKIARIYAIQFDAFSGFARRIFWGWFYRTG
jgi:hypothetical protein